MADLSEKLITDHRIWYWFYAYPENFPPEKYFSIMLIITGKLIFTASL
jgi:hypothetical protein